MKKHSEYGTQTDEKLFGLIQEGRERAFEELYARYERRLYSYCLTVLKDRNTAEDAFQTTMLHVFKNREMFKGGNFEAWFFTIARNNCLKAKRHAARTDRIEDVGDSLANLEDRTGEDVMMREAFHRALEALPEDFRQPIQLKYIGGFSYEEIARRLDISMSLVKVRIFRAKKILKQNLQPYLEEI